MSKTIDVFLSNYPLPFRLEIGFNFEKYKIKKGYLYKGFKKIGKIVRIAEVKYE